MGTAIIIIVLFMQLCVTVNIGDRILKQLGEVPKKRNQNKS